MAKHPVVVYGASGYTGMLIMDWLIDQNIPFTAVARNAKRAQEMMAQRVVRLESATYEIVEAEHTVESLTTAFRGAKVVCNTVGPFVNFGLTAVEAALKAGCHHIDTTGEQGYIRAVREQFGELYRQAGLLVSPSIAYMYTFAEIAAELALETPGIDVLETATLCRGPRGGASGVTVGSTASIFELYRPEACYLWEKKLVPHARDASINAIDPSFVQPVFALPWGGTSLPVYFENDATRAQLQLLRRLLRQQRDADGACAGPEVGGGVQGPAQRSAGRGDQGHRRFDHADACRRANAPPCNARWTLPSAAASSPPCVPRCTASRPTFPPVRCRSRR